MTLVKDVIGVISTKNCYFNYIISDTASISIKHIFKGSKRNIFVCHPVQW